MFFMTLYAVIHYWLVCVAGFIMPLSDVRRASLLSCKITGTQVASRLDADWIVSQCPEMEFHERWICGDPAGAVDG